MNLKINNFMMSCNFETLWFYYLAADIGGTTCKLGIFDTIT